MDGCPWGGMASHRCLSYYLKWELTWYHDFFLKWPMNISGSPQPWPVDREDGWTSLYKTFQICNLRNSINLRYKKHISRDCPGLAQWLRLYLTEFLAEGFWRLNSASADWAGNSRADHQLHSGCWKNAVPYGCQSVELCLLPLSPQAALFLPEHVLHSFS